MSFHTRDVPQTLELLETTQEGLTEKEALRRLEHYGPNLLPEGKKKGLALIFLDQFKSPIIYVLLIAAAVSFAIREFTDAWFIMGVLFINAFIGTFQEYTAGQKADSLKQAVRTRSVVLRNGKPIEILSEEVTVGDAVVLESGVKSPADMRLLRSVKLNVNESLLTGESTDVFKESGFLSEDPELPVADRKNMIYAGSFVASGRGVGVVTAIAEETEVGKIAALLAKQGGGKPPLIARMERFSMNIAVIVGTVAGLLALLGLYQGAGIKEIFFFTVAMAVSAIPEGLPVAITVALTSASIVMSKRNVIVRKLSAIEGLGSCTLIASDKTGTLTRNQLTVKHFVTPDRAYDSGETPGEGALLTALLCNEATVKSEPEGLAYLGDQVDIALARYVLEAASERLEQFENRRPLAEIPYEPENRYAAALVEVEGKRYQLVKGSPEVVLEFCGMEGDDREAVLAQVDDWAGKGYRNIALAWKAVEGEKIDLDGLEYLGFTAIIDPLRDGVAEAVATAQKAGIEVVMITGDHPNTAYAIASELGIAVDREEVMDGGELKRWEEQGEKPEEIGHKRVFARVSPEQKQKIVLAFQKLDHFVAVTGDGVNDAPALKYANIGISMGKSGTDVARESSDMILTDDSFASIVGGIEEGRVAYDNIRKVIYLLISTGGAELVLVILSMLFFLPLPLLPVQLLWLNLVTNGIQDVALGLEKGEPGVLRRKPRPPKEPIFNGVMVRRVLVGGLYMGVVAFIVFYSQIASGVDEHQARNITLFLMVLFENVHVFNSRSEWAPIHKINHRQNLFLVISVFMAQGVHIGCMYIPFTENLLDVQPISFAAWLELAAIALGLVVVMEIDKYLRLRKATRE